MENRKYLVPICVELWTFQPVASSCTDWALSVPIILTVAALNSRRRTLCYCPKSIYSTICYSPLCVLHIKGQKSMTRIVV